MTEAAVGGQLRGLDYPTAVVRECINSSGFDLDPGDIVMLSESSGNAIPGDPGSTNANFVAPQLAFLSYARFGVLQEAIADGHSGDVMFRGFTVLSVGGAVSIGNGLKPVTLSASLTPLTGAGGEKAIAIAREAIGGAGLIECEFDGLAGFGSDTA